MGAERRSLVMTEDEKRMTAYHEAGHALAALHLPECDPVHKATIIPRGRALGLVMSLPEGDRYSKHKSKLLSELAMAMGGRVAEELIFGPDKVSNGASGDIKMATDQTRRDGHRMGHVREARHDRLRREQPGGLPRPLRHPVEELVRGDRAADRRRDPPDHRRGLCPLPSSILSENIDELHLLAKGLLEHETLSGDEIRLVIKGEPVVRSRPDEPAPAGRGSVPSSGRAPRPGSSPGGLEPGARAGDLAGHRRRAVAGAMPDRTRCGRSRWTWLTGPAASHFVAAAAPACRFQGGPAAFSPGAADRRPRRPRRGARAARSRGLGGRAGPRDRAAAALRRAARPDRPAGHGHRQRHAGQLLRRRRSRGPPRRRSPAGHAMLEAGADLLDIGGELHPPRRRAGAAGGGDAPRPARGARAGRRRRRSRIDTRNAATMRAALDAGRARSSTTSAPCATTRRRCAVVAERGAPVVLMHMLGLDPRTMQRDPRYDDVALEVARFLRERVEAAERAGIPRGRIAVDPGIGFGKTVAHNLALIDRLPLLAGIGCRILLGASRKGFARPHLGRGGGRAARRAPASPPRWPRVGARRRHPARARRGGNRAGACGSGGPAPPARPRREPAWRDDRRRDLMRHRDRRERDPDRAHDPTAPITDCRRLPPAACSAPTASAAPPTPRRWTPPRRCGSARRPGASSTAARTATAW